MEKARFKVGDKVRLSQQFIDEMNEMGFTWYKEMEGIVMTVKEVLMYNGYAVDESPYLVSESWVEGVPDDARDQ